MNITNYLKQDRDPGWNELFFDLAFAALLGRMAHILFHVHDGHIEMISIVTFLWIFSIQFLVWMLFTVYMNIYGNNTLNQNIFTFSLMIGLVTTVIMMNDIVENSRYIALTLGVMSLIISFMYRKSRNCVEGNKGYAIYKSKSLLVLALFTTLNIFMSPVFAIIYTLLIYTLEHALDEMFLKNIGSTRPDGKHFIERIGIFMILLIGESFITLVNNIKTEISIDTLYPYFTVLIILFGIFINYYTHNEKLEECKYDRYSQILIPNAFIMFAMTILPAIIYHSIYQELNIGYYKMMIFIFSLFFFGGNGFMYTRGLSCTSFKATLYATIPTIAISLYLIMVDSYSYILFGFALIVIITEMLIIYSYRKGCKLVL